MVRRIYFLRTFSSTHPQNLPQGSLNTGLEKSQNTILTAEVPWDYARVPRTFVKMSSYQYLDHWKSTKLPKITLTWTGMKYNSCLLPKIYIYKQSIKLKNRMNGLDCWIVYPCFKIKLHLHTPLRVRTIISCFMLGIKTRKWLNGIIWHICPQIYTSGVPYFVNNPAFVTGWFIWKWGFILVIIFRLYNSMK